MKRNCVTSHLFVTLICIFFLPLPLSSPLKEQAIYVSWKFPTLLEFCNSTCGSLLIMDDFDVYYECRTSTRMSTILDCISIFNIVQPISTPTHKCGHILDWILHRSMKHSWKVLLSPMSFVQIIVHHLSSRHVHCKLSLCAIEQAQSYFYQQRQF